MITVPNEILALASQGFWHGAIVFLRTSALVSVLPAFGERTVPMRVKLGVAVAFTVIVAPAVAPMSPHADLLRSAQLAVSEIVIGLAFGMAIRLFVLALQTAGAIAAQATSLSQLLGGGLEEPSAAMGHVLVVSGLALAVGFGLHVRAAELVVYSYDLFPAGRFPSGDLLSAWGLSRVSHAFGLAFTLAAPFVIASLIYNLTLGVINRAMPQLMVAFVGAPAITLGGLFILCVSAPMILTAWHGAFTAFFIDPTRVP